MSRLILFILVTCVCFVAANNGKIEYHLPIHSKSEKVCGTAFSVKKFAEKVRKSGRHIWAIWGNFGPFWVIFGPF